MPEKVADTGSKAMSLLSARSRVMVVFPTPGGPAGWWG